MLKAIFNDDCTELTVEGLSQWDKGRTLEIQYSDMPKFCKVHFGFVNGRTSIPVYPKEIGGGAMLLDIPNSLISYSYDLIAYVYEIYPDGRQIATKVINLPIEKRPKPMDYIADDVSASEQLEAMLADIQECMATKAALKDAVVVNGEVRYPSEGLEYELNEDGESYKVVGLGTCADINVVVPRKYNGLPITAIGDNAFEGANIDSINLWETVKSVGNKAFKDCSPFRFVYIYSETPIHLYVSPFPDTVKGYFVPLHSVDTYKRRWTVYADKIVAIETPESINTSIVNVFNAAMYSDQELKSNLQNQISSLDRNFYDYVFNPYSKGLSCGFWNDPQTGLCVTLFGIGSCEDTELIIPPYFAYGGNLHKIDRVQEGSFNGNVAITKIIFPKENIKTIRTAAFTNCTNLKEIELSGSVETLMEYAFMGCSNLAEVVIPKNIKDIRAGVFANCSNLKRVTFLSETPPNIATAGNSVTFPDTVEEYRVPASSVETYKTTLTNVFGEAYGAKVKPIETLETLRADIDAIKAELTESIAEIDTLIGGGE